MYTLLSFLNVSLVTTHDLISSMSESILVMGLMKQSTFCLVLPHFQEVAKCVNNSIKYLLFILGENKLCELHKT